VDEFDEKTDETHDGKSDGRGSSNSQEFFNKQNQYALINVPTRPNSEN